MTRIRVVVVEDSVTVRRHLCAVLSAQPDIEVVGEAGDGQQAIALCEALRPDVVTMDMMLPVMTGLAATEYIMAHCPTPILIVSSSLNRGEIMKTCEALAAGAVEAVEKPSGDEAEGTWEAAFLAAVRVVSRVRPIPHLRARLTPSAFGRSLVAASGADAARVAPRVVAIGASTGGPGAILRVLKALPQPFPVPLLLVLHINEPFGQAFAQWLGGQTGFRVESPADGASVADAAGRVSLAPSGQHMLVRGGRFRLTNDPARHSCRPSIDVLFESLAREYGAGAAACLLTGMGRDGASGLLSIRAAGGYTIAQDEASSVVYGMPREAARLGAAVQILPLSDIGPALAAAALQSRELS
jgi:two-component system chemotaxis response regulator CheB